MALVRASTESHTRTCMSRWAALLFSICSRFCRSTGAFGTIEAAYAIHVVLARRTCFAWTDFASCLDAGSRIKVPLRASPGSIWTLQRSGTLGLGRIILRMGP